MDAMAPLLGRIGEDLAAAYAEAVRLIQAPPGGLYVQVLAAALDRVQEYVTEFERLGGTLRSYAPIEVEFLAEVEGALGYLVWQPGNDGASAPFVDTGDLCRSAVGAGGRA